MRPCQATLIAAALPETHQSDGQPGCDECHEILCECQRLRAEIRCAEQGQNAGQEDQNAFEKRKD